MPNSFQSFPGPAPAPMRRQQEDDTPQYSPEQFPPSLSPPFQQPTPQSTQDVKVIAAHWLFGQPANTITLYVIVAVLIIGGYMAGTTWIPAHLSQIQRGYEKLDDNNKVEMKKVIEDNRNCVKELADRHEKACDKLGTTFEKAMDKYEKSFNEGVRSVRSAKD